ncbi:hypothetical protein K8B33_14065 [Alcanivorax sp. JB21]|uniref:hypothetical protein n=1 Tax=Alcanivorax limicola TaxID=2874102 RepID=UPI001CBBB3B2|nr:hypothetical protein [Alcanivorax limicola]MBZ2190230.1 hypothetical protein [Alcanivorax limicola]
MHTTPDTLPHACARPAQSARRKLNSFLGSLVAAALLMLALQMAPATASQAQASVFQPTELTPVNDAERERAEKRRKVLLIYPAAVIGLVIVLVLTIKRKK